MSGSAHTFAWTAPDSKRLHVQRKVEAGDKMSLQVTYARGGYEIEMQDMTRQWGYYSEGDGAGGPPATFVAIAVHGRHVGSDYVPVAQFEPVTFSDCEIDGRPLDQASPQRTDIESAER